MGWLWGRRQRRPETSPPIAAIDPAPPPLGPPGPPPPLSYRNSTAVPLRITIEPSAEEYAILPGQEVEIAVISLADDIPVLFDQHPGGLSIWVQGGDAEIEVRSSGGALKPFSGEWYKHFGSYW